MAALFSSTGNGDEPSQFARDEFEHRRTTAKTGSRIAATLGPLGEFESGITLLFADARTDFGILTLLRTAELGPFTSSEISVLTLALDAASDRLSALRLQPVEHEPVVQHGHHERGLASESAESAFYVLDTDLQIVLAWSSEDQRRIALTGLHTRIAERLPPVLEETVRELTAGWSSGGAQEPGVGHPVPFLVIHTRPMSGPAGLFIGVRLDRFQPPNSLTGAAERFHISPREVQVLALLLDGNHLDQIATRLHITSSTVQDHIRNMLEKTSSRNRSELISRVLGWDSTPGSGRFE
ncbi:MAG TPA: helix-turn-helix transcriptional regulator [Candidatus Baltobacteraceae bacterium]|nr:helix-turn-helix transcriptional regulator [Candidatus Baltobacteraceae bacterium]